jgi:VWFA-related protein
LSIRFLAVDRGLTEPSRTQDETPTLNAIPWRYLITCCALFPVWAATAKTPVFVTASLVDKNNLFIEDLTQNEIQILENDQPRSIEFMAKDELPVAYGIIFDRAMLPDFEDIDRSRRAGKTGAVSGRDIAYELIDKHLGKQVIWVGTYDRELEVALDFSPDAFRVKEAIQQLRGVRSNEESFFYGALFKAVTKMNQRSEKRRVLVLLLDAIDSGSAGKAKSLRNLLSSSNIELFIISFASKMGGGRPGMPYNLSEAVFKDLAYATSGDAFSSASYGDHLEDLSRRIYNHIRTFYTFGFQSEATPDKPAKLSIRCLRSGAKVKHHATVAP